MSAKGFLRYLLKAVAMAAVAVALLPVISSAVLVAPHAVFIDHRTRTGQITLANSGTEAEEVQVELKFGDRKSVV